MSKYYTDGKSFVTSEPVKERRDTTPKAVVFDGKPYPSMNNLCKSLGLKRATLDKMVKDGMKLDDAISRAVVMRDDESRKFYVDKVKYTSIRAIARKYNMSIELVKQSMVKNHTTEEKLLESLRIATQKIEFRGVWYPHIGALAKAWGIDQSIVHKRLTYGWSLERAVSEGIHKHNTPIEFRGIKYISHLALAKAFDINYTTFLQRLDSGRSLEEVIFFKPKQSFKSVKVSYNGVEYPSISSLCNALELKYNRLHYLIRRGDSVDSAVASLLNEKGTNKG